MTDISARRLFILAVAALLLGIVIGVIMVTTASAAPADACDPAYTAQCCACEPSGAAEPAPLPRLYLPSVMHGVRMTSEYTPAQPIVTPEPDPPVTGDVQ